MSETINPLGNIYISQRAIATIAYQAALDTYGLVGLTAKNLAVGIAQALVKDPTLGIDVSYDGQKIKIDLYVIMEYGTRIKSVAASVSDAFATKLKKQPASLSEK